MVRNTKEDDIKGLIAAMEEAVGFTCTSAPHFEKLRDYVYAHTAEYISETTLKRLWGYLDENVSTRKTSLSILARSLGFSDWDDFLQRNDLKPSEKKIPSNPSFGNSINVLKDLRKGDRVMLYWYPGRECLVEYTGDINFKVIESVKTRLSPGDTFSTHLILEGHPLYLSNLVRATGKGESTAYVCGKIHGGIFFKKLKKSPEESD